MSVPPTWTVREHVVAVYFTATGVGTTGVRDLLSHKCKTSVSESAIERQLALRRCGDTLYDTKTGCWRQEKVGKFLKGLIKESQVFEELIKWGPEEEAIVSQVCPDSGIFVVYRLRNY